MTQSEITLAKSPDVYLSLKLGSARKTGPRSNGCVHYRILSDQAQAHLYITLVDNDSGGAYSKEVLAFTKICSCLEGIDTRKPIASNLFQKAFLGKSANNAGFLAAILRAEHLLEPTPDSVHQHIVKPEWTAWETTMLALAAKAESYQPEPPKLRSYQTTIKKVEAHKNTPLGLQDSQLPSREPPAEVILGVNAAIVGKEDELDDVEFELLQCSALGSDLCLDEDEIDVTKTVATLLDKQQSRKQRNEKRPHPTGQGNLS